MKKTQEQKQMNINKRKTEFWHSRFLVQAQWTKTLRTYLLDKFWNGTNAKILDVGCGTGAIIPQLSDQPPSVYGIDLDEDFINFYQSNTNETFLTLGDGQKLPYKDNYFDIVYCHFLLLWVDKPENVVSEFVRVGRPGGNVFIFAEPDYGGRVDYPPELEALGEAQIKSLRLQGADPYLGRRLKEIAGVAGLKIIETGILGSEMGHLYDEETWASEWQMINYDLNTILPKDTIGNYKEIDQFAWKNGIRTLFIPTFYLSGKITT